MSDPLLVDSGFRDYLRGALMRAHGERLAYYNRALNWALFAAIAVAAAAFCYGFYAKRDSPMEAELKQRAAKDFIMARIGLYQAEARRAAAQADLLTDLPTGAAPEFREMFEL